MARKARVKSEFGTYHIIQKGGSCRPLFISNADRDKFVSILQKSQEKNGFILHGFCLMNGNAYDLIISPQGSDLSKIMKSINISYAMYAKCEGKLFSDRYKSYELKGPVELYEAKRLIRNKENVDQCEECYSVCYDDFHKEPSYDICFDDCNNCMTCISDAQDKLAAIAASKGLTTEEILKDKETRNTLIKAFRQNSTLSLKTLGSVFGGISESSVSKILSK